MDATSDKFARAFGEALKVFLDEKGISVTEAANRVEINKQTLSTYWTDNAKGKRPLAGSDVLFAACNYTCLLAVSLSWSIKKVVLRLQ